MKTFKTLFTILILASSNLLAITCSDAPTTKDISNSAIVNTADAQDISSLEGEDCSGAPVNSFRIFTLPAANSGVLYMADGTTAVTVNQTLTRAEADGLKFDPKDGFTGDATFRYGAIDENGYVDLLGATVTIPVTGGHPGGGTCTEAPTTDNKHNDNLSNTLGATDIINLSGKDCNGADVNKFRIVTLPDANSGVLYMADGVTAVTAGQTLTQAEADGLKFDPKAGFTGDATFTYAAIDSNGNVDDTPATVTIPVTGGHPGGGVCNEAPTTDDKHNDNLLNTLGATDIINLSGKDCNGAEVNKFRIVTLPNANSGVLYMADGVTPVTVGQTLTRAEADGLKFDPKDGFTGNATFTYAAIDANGNVDDTPATVTVPVIAGAGACTAPTTENIDNPNLLNTLGAVDILNLAGKDCHGDDVNKFRIVTLPAANSGVLYMADGVTPVTVGQTLTRAEADGLKFDPSPDFTGNVSFTYAAIDSNGKVDDTPATVTIPVIAGAGGACAEAPTTEDLQNPNLLNTLGAVNILNLSGKDCHGTLVESFRIVTLPDEAAGVLYMADGVTRVTVGQTLTRAEANGLRFDPRSGFTGNATFTYAAIDENGNVDATPATVILPIVAGGGAGGHGGACNEAPTTDSINNPALLNTLGAVNILNLAGRDCAGTEVESFRIVSLPDAAAGVLYMADGVTPVTVGQTLTRAEADGLRFDPVEGYVGDATFTYVAIDANGNVDATPATVTIPLINNGDAVTDIVANPDTAIAHGNADPIVINVLDNDTGHLDGARVYLLNADGTVTDRLVVEGEGVWTVNTDNTIIFTPAAGFVGTPTPVRYLVEDANGARSGSALITITGECVCEDYTTSGIPSLSMSSLLLLVLLISASGLFFMRKEELN